ncbi:hypothetical protein F5146DRAFT_1102113 [Armillaria mellea]|nr:hypothetical protein F5146DRAFT_1102113 [Armillaria mellea]
MHRGNHLGETLLIRTILSMHSYDAQSLPQLLSCGLSESIMTLDTSRKSVLHRIVMLAARYCLDQTFLWIAKEDGGNFAKILIAARVGSRTLVRMLVDIGANKMLMNKLGLKPGDFGVESEVRSFIVIDLFACSLQGLSRGPKLEDILATLQSIPPKIKGKQDALDVTQAHLRAVTRELSEQRKQIHMWQGCCAELDMLAQRVQNVEHAVEEEVQFDWMGHGGESGLELRRGSEGE